MPLLLQETLEKLLHPPPLATVLLLASALFLLPQKYRLQIMALIDNAFSLDLLTLAESLPSLAQVWVMALHHKGRFLDPLTSILFGWEPSSPANSDFYGQDLVDRCNSTVLPDRTKITSRAQLGQFHLSQQQQGLTAIGLTGTKLTAPSAFPFVHGLVNTGNSCFLNSVLQALSALSFLLPYLESLLDGADELRLANDEVQVAEALLETLEALQQPLASHKAFRPRDIVSALEESRSRDSKASGYHSNIMNREQQDAQELFQIISSALSSEEVAVQKLQATRPLLHLDFLKKLVGLGHESRVQKLPSNPMNGMLASRLSCMQCGYTEAIRHFTFDNLSLSLPSTHACTIEDCLKQYINLESLHDVVCRKCSLIATLARIGNDLKLMDGMPVGQSRVVQRRLSGTVQEQSTEDEDEAGSESLLDSDDEPLQRPWRRPLRIQTQAEKAVVRSRLVQQKRIVEAAIKTDVEATLPDIKLSKVVSRHCTKQVMLAKPPPILCLHFVRSQYSNYGTVSKNSCHVNFPEILDLSPFCTTGVLLTQPNLPMSVSQQDLDRMGYDRSGQKDSKAEDRKNYLYRLQSIVVHYGGHSYGHFIAYRRKPESMLSKVGTVGLGLDTPRTSRAGSLYGAQSEDWFRISDETVESVTLNNVLGANPYMLLYEKVERPKDEDGKQACSSNLSFQAVEMGLLKLLRRQGQEAAGQEKNHGHAKMDSNVDFSSISEKEYAQMFKDRPKAVSAIRRMGHLEQDEDMSDMESFQSQDEDRAWRSFVSSPNSTTPPSPDAGSASSSTTSSSFTSPLLRQRTNHGRRDQGQSLPHQSLNHLRIQSACLSDLDLTLGGALSRASSSPSNASSTSTRTPSPAPFTLSLVSSSSSSSPSSAPSSTASLHTTTASSPSSSSSSILSSITTSASPVIGLSKSARKRNAKGRKNVSTPAIVTASSNTGSK